MKKPRIALFLILLPLYVCCTVKEPSISQPSVNLTPSGAFVPGEALVLLSESAADAFEAAALSDRLNELGVTSMVRVFPDAGELEARHRAAGLHRWYRVYYDQSIPQTKANGDLSSLPGVEAVMSQPKKERQSYFNDPGLPTQWDLINNGKNGSKFMPGMDINVLPVWEQFTGGSRDVIVAVIDGGVQINHPDLDGVVLTAEEGSRNFVTGRTPKMILADDHGTHVAGTIAAINNNNIGISGVAGGLDGNGGVRVMTCAIFDEQDRPSDEAAALVWAADHGAVIANNSWGYVHETEADAEAAAEAFMKNPSAIRDAIDYFIQYAGTDADGNQTGPMKGGLVIFASGNDRRKNAPPGCYPPVITVGAFGPDGKMARYSNYGPWVDILAPGGSDSETNYEEWILNLFAGSRFGYMVGTSMAAPHVAGVAALLVSYFGGPGFTADDLKEALLKGTVPNVIGSEDNRRVDGGKLDAFGAFSVLLDPVHPGESDISFSTQYHGNWQLKSHESVDIVINISGNRRAELPVNVSSDCPGVTFDCAPQLALIHINALLAEPGDYTATVSVGSLAAKSYSFKVLPNHAPQLTGSVTNRIANAATGEVFRLDLSQYFTDTDGEKLRFSVSTDESILNPAISDNTLTLRPVGYGEAVVTICASDAHNVSAETSFRVLSRNTFQDMDIFPNPVSDKLNIRPGDERSVSVELVNAVGATVYSDLSVQAGPFNPLTVDMSEMTGGIYTLLVDGKRFTIAKK